MIELHHGDQLKVDYTPGSAVTGGDSVLVGTDLWVATSDIAANELGSMAAPNSNCVYRVPLEAAHSAAIGAVINVDPATGTTSSAGGTAFGKAVAAFDQGAGDTHALLQHIPN